MPGSIAEGDQQQVDAGVGGSDRRGGLVEPDPGQGSGTEVVGDYDAVVAEDAAQQAPITRGDCDAGRSGSRAG